MEPSIQDCRKQFPRNPQHQSCPRPNRNFQASASVEHPIQGFEYAQFSEQGLSEEGLRDLETLKQIQNLQHILKALKNIEISGQQQNQQYQNPPKVPSRMGPPTGPRATGSLDEMELNMAPNRRYTPAPRRARSAERFEGMRVNQQNQHLILQANGVGKSAGGESWQRKEENFSKSYQSPQILQQMHKNSITSISTTGSGSTAGPGPVNVTQYPNFGPEVKRPVPVVGVGAPLPLQMTINSKYSTPSPPPSYSTATSKVEQKRDHPPHYNQVMAPGIYHGGSISTQSLGSSSQSTSMASTPRGKPNQGKRSMDFPAMNNSCGCHKCDPRASKADYRDDAVIMDAHPVLMHEIMTDGMALCTIV